MKARHSYRTQVGVLTCVLLLVAACTTDGSSDSSGAPPTDAGPTATATATSDAREAADTPAPCPSEPLRSWAVGALETRRLVARGDLGDVAVRRTGTATIAWTASVDSGEVRTLDDPAAPGDPQSPAGPPDPQHRELLDAFGKDDALGIDATGVQTLLWLSDERGPSGGPSPFNENFDVVLADRSPGGGWSSSPSVVGSGHVYNARLAVNPSGAAVVTWLQYEHPHPRVYASYRVACRRRLAPTELVAQNASPWGVGIDDAGRVLPAVQPRTQQPHTHVRGPPHPDRRLASPESPRRRGHRRGLGSRRRRLCSGTTQQRLLRHRPSPRLAVHDSNDPGGPLAATRPTASPHRSR